MHTPRPGLRPRDDRRRHLVPDLGVRSSARAYTRTSSIRPAKVLAVGRVAADPQRVGGNLDAPAHRTARHLVCRSRTDARVAPSYVTATYDQRSTGKIGRSAGVLDRAVEGAAAGRHQRPASFLGHHAREQQERAEHDRRAPGRRGFADRGALLGVSAALGRARPRSPARRGGTRAGRPCRPHGLADSESTTGPCQSLERDDPGCQAEQDHHAEGGDEPPHATGLASPTRATGAPARLVRRALRACSSNQKAP